MSNLIGRTVRYTFKNGDTGEATVLFQQKDAITVETRAGGRFSDNFKNFSYYSESRKSFVKYSGKVTIDII